MSYAIIRNEKYTRDEMNQLLLMSIEKCTILTKL